jgi:class 3 adenylate cyclase
VSSCQTCGRDVAEGFTFCPYCGAALLNAASAGEERKLVTLLFADVSGSTRLAEALDAEEVRELMGEYFALAREEIEAQGGTVEKFIGDAVMAVFGVPTAHEDDAARALRAALRIQRRLTELNERLRAEGRSELAVRIGVNTGEVVATTAPRAGEGMVTGDAVNVASRIQQMAEPGQIVVGQRTVAASPTFEYRALGARQVRGKTAAVEVRELLAELTEASDRGVPGLRAPLVGRDAELDLLISLYERVASEGRPHLVTLYGQPGVGKSRLTAEFLSALSRQVRAPRVVRGRCLSYGSGVTFWPLAEILKHEAHIFDSDPPADAVVKLQALGQRLLTAELAADPVRATALLGYTVGIAVPGFEFGRLDPEQLRAEIHAAWRSFFSALATTGPLVVIVEDIHWADGAMLDLLDELAERVHGGVLLLCPARPDLTDRRPGWGGGRRSFSSVFLDPLPRDETSRLLNLLLSIAELPPALHEQIIERADGNPFFVEEIIRHLIDQGRIVRSQDGWRAAAPLTEVEIPDTIQSVLAARIDLLGTHEKRTLQAAAVVGRVFWPAPIGRFLNGAAERVGELLRGLEVRDLVLLRLGSTIAGQPEYIFKHALVRDVAYESIPKRDRAAAHLRVAEWIEDVVGERRIEVIELLAHHYTEAERATAWAKVEPNRREEIRARAVDLLFEAGEEAARHLATERARERVRVGLELAQGPIERARGLQILVNMQLWADDGDGAWRSAREAIDLRMGAGPVSTEDRRAVARLAGLLLAMPTRWPGLMRNLPSRAEAAPYLQLGLSMLEEGDSEERVRLLLARAAWSWGFAEAETEPERVQEDHAAAEEAVAMARRLGRADLLSAALDALGAAGTLLGGYRLSQVPQEERLLLIPQLDDMIEVVDIYGTNAWHLVHIGDYRRAAELGAIGWARSSEMGVGNYTPGVFYAVATFRLGKWDEFWRIFTAVNAAHGLSDREKVLRYHSYRLLGVAAYLSEVAGDSAAADRHIERLDSSQAVQGSVGISGPRTWIVMTLVRRREFAAARARLAVRDPVRDIQNRDLTLEAWADLIAAEGTWDEAAALVAEARAWAARTGLRFLPGIADRLEGQTALATGDHQAAVRLLEAARDTFTRLEVPWERARTELSLAQAYLAEGDGPGAATAARSALETFGGLDAPVETEDAAALVARASGLAGPKR